MADDSRAQRHVGGEVDRDVAAALHEVANALTVVLGWLEAADARVKSGLEGRTAEDAALLAAGEAVGVALSRARRGHRIARRAIGATPRSGALEDALPPQPESLGGVLDECVRGLFHVARQGDVRVETSIPDEVRAANVQAGERFLQVLTNLLLNGISVTPPGSVVNVVAAFDGGKPPTEVVMRVTDGGSGVPPLERPRIFQRGASGRPGGAGIGLSHAQAVALEEGGNIALLPYEPGRGATFELAWPLSDASPITAPMTVRPTQLDGFRIAVMDDDAAVVELLETVLTARGATVTSARNLAALRGLLARTPADVALVDASPLGPSLEQALGALRTGSPKTEFVLISGAPDPGHAAERLGVTWLRKPFEVIEVIEVLRLVVEHRRGG